MNAYQCLNDPYIFERMRVSNFFRGRHKKRGTHFELLVTPAAAGTFFLIYSEAFSRKQQGFSCPRVADKQQEGSRHTHTAVFLLFILFSMYVGRRRVYVVLVVSTVVR